MYCYQLFFFADGRVERRRFNLAFLEGEFSQHNELISRESHSSDKGSASTLSFVKGVMGIDAAKKKQH